MRKSLCLFYIPRRRLSINLRNLNKLPTSFKPVEDFGMLYVYFYKDETITRLIYCGKDNNPPRRLNDHERDDKDIIEASNYVGIIYYTDYNQLSLDEIDILEGNSFEKNIQHNC